MGRIQTDTGLSTGIPITDTVNKLMALAGKPRNALTQKNADLTKQQTAITQLSALLLSVQYITKNLEKDDLYAKRSATSSAPSALAATVTGSPPLGTYQFTPLRSAQSQQLLSSGFKSTADSLGGGTLTFRFGDTVQRSASLANFGAGQGVSRGKIRITDRSGASAQIDLSSTQTVDDVLSAINTAGTVNVTAVAQDGHIRLIDNTGQTVAHLKVQEVGNGNTAASLGLAGIDTAAATADGQDMLRLYDNLDLEALNDGAGVSRNNVLSDIQYTLRDGTTGQIDLSPIIAGGSQVDTETTLGEVLDRINTAAQGKLTVEISADGKRLLATDQTSGAGTLQLTSINNSDALHDLGLDGPSASGTITGRRILADTNTVLLSSLNGGNGLGQLGQLQLTDRSGATAAVDLSGAETLDQVIEQINAAGLGITAAINQAANGIQLTDITGASTNNLTVANGDTTTHTADKLNIAATGDGGTTTVQSGDLHLRVVARNTRLTDLDGGAGVAQGTVALTDSNGVRATLNLKTDSIQTVGDVIDAINRLATGIRAGLNDTGDGILLTDTAHGTGTMVVAEGSSTTARDLHLLRPAATVDREGAATQVIDGTTTETISLAGTDSLADLAQHINDRAAGVTATVFSDGSSKPYRLSLSSNRPGTAGKLVFDTSQMNMTLQETSHAQDALLAFGSSTTAASNPLLSASTNVFTNVLPGMNLEIKSATGSPVSVNVGTSDTDLVASVQTLVDNYNKFRAQLKAATAYDSASDTPSTLTGNPAALRLDMDFSDLLSSPVYGAGSIHSLAQLGISLKDDGSLDFDSTKLRAQYTADPASVQQFFAQKDTGFSAKLDKLIEQTAGETNSMLAARLKSLSDTITDNQQRIDAMNKRLDDQQQQLLTKFYLMDVAIGKMKNDLNVVNQIQYIAPVYSTTNSNSTA